jgi:hypothetical protein
MDGTSALTPSGYNPPATLSATRCMSDSNKIEFNIKGGPFLAWGGGLGVSMAHFNGMETNLCGGTNHPDICPPVRAGDPVSSAALDLSDHTNSKGVAVRGWDGVSFWARRGPTSQPLLRVLVGDKFTDDDLSYLADTGDPQHLQPRFCERIKECGCFYQNLTCAPYPPTAGGGVQPDGVYYCGAPGSSPAPAVMAPTPNMNLNCPNGDGGVIGCATNTCNHTRCDEAYPAYPGNGADIKFAGRPCTPYVFRNGINTAVCYDPAKDPPPAEPNELCGDFWTYPVVLTTEWKFFKVPFTQMYQQGWAKKAPYFDTASVSVVRFTWDAGMIDYYVDDLRFYRAKQ